VCFEELRKDLEDERSEFGNVLLENGVERREESVFESGQGRRVSSRNESKPMESVISMVVQIQKQKTDTHRTRAEILSKVK
jgi:hypothetical protein